MRDLPEGNDLTEPEGQVGDIEGAFGTIHVHETRTGRSWPRRLITLAAIMGPGMIVMVGDNDAGGIWTYSQAGLQYGLTLLWTLLLLVPVLIVNQEMVVRLGAVTGVGHARLINERFGRFWGAFSVGDLFILNFLTIATEFIGIGLATSYFGVSQYISVPVAAVAFIAMTATGSFRRWERFMFIFVVASLLIFPLSALSHPRAGPFFRDLVVPGVQGGFNSTSVLLIIAIVGTTVAPWQLFFQQSNVIDKRITSRWVNYERADTILGSIVTEVVAILLVGVTAVALSHTPSARRITDSLGVAHGLDRYIGHPAGALYAIILLDASIIGAIPVTLSTSYAFGDMFGTRHSLHRTWREAKFFYGTFSAMVVLAAGLVVLPGAPLGLITEGVQALAGVLLPSATVFLLLLCNDKEVLGPWVNRPWLNVLGSVIVSLLLVMSLVLMATTLFSRLNVRVLAAILGIALLIAYLIGGVAMVRTEARRPPTEAMSKEQRAKWRMPPLNLLRRPVWSRTRTLAMWSLRSYLVISVLMLVVKAIELGVAK